MVSFNRKTSLSVWDSVRVIIRDYSVIKVRPMLSLSVVKELLIWIEENLEEPLNLSILEKKSGYGKTQLQKAFKKVTGLNVATYIRHRRLCKTSTILKLTNIPIINVAILYHFGSQQNYSRAFKQFFKVSPSKFRKNNIDFSESILPHIATPHHTENLEVVYFGGKDVFGTLINVSIKSDEIFKSKDINNKLLYSVKKRMSLYENKEKLYTVIKYGPSIDKVGCLDISYMIGVPDDDIYKSSECMTIPSGWYAKKTYSGSWLGYIGHSIYIYMHLLPKYKVKRRDGVDFEIFYKIDGNDGFLLCEYYIPVVCLPD